MSGVRELREKIDVPDEIKQAGLDGSLVLFVGAGVSMLLGLPSWQGLAASVLEELRTNKYLNYSEIEQLKNLDPKKQLSIAFLIAKQNKYRIETEKYLNKKNRNSAVYEHLNKIGSSCVTTNYDEFLEPKFVNKKDGSKTAPKANRVFDRERMYAKLLNEPGSVVHLHGCIQNADSMVITTKDYLEHYDSEKVQSFLGELFEKKTVLFLGYGLEEAEILETILRRGRVKGETERKRFAIQGFFRSELPLYEKLSEYYENSFGVHLLGFIRDFENYDGLEEIIRSWADQIEIREPPLVEDLNFMNEVLGDEWT